MPCNGDVPWCSRSYGSNGEVWRCGLSSRFFWINEDVMMWWVYPWTSSAYNWWSNPWEKDASLYLLYRQCTLYIQKRSRTESWRTSKGAWTQADLEEPNATQFVRSERNERSHSRGLSVRPKDVERRWRRILWSTESNAELTSKSAGP